MKKFLFSTLIAALILAACAAPKPVAPAAPEALALKPTAVASPVTQPTQPPAKLPSTGLSTTSPEPSPTPACSANAPLSEGLPIMTWSTRLYHNLLTPYDPKLGQPICGYASLQFREYNLTGFSPDGKKLAVVDYSRDDFSDGMLHLVDLQTWQAVTSTLTIRGWGSQVAFNPHGTQLALVYQDGPSSPENAPTGFILQTINLPDFTSRAQLKLDFAPHLVKYTPDGASLILFGGAVDVSRPDLARPTSQTATALLVNAADLSLAWRVPLPKVKYGMAQISGSESEPYLFEGWEPGAALSPDGSRLYVVHADEDKLTTINFTERKVITVTIQPKMSRLERLIGWGAEIAYAKGMNGTFKRATLSPDGQRLFVTGTANTAAIDKNGQMQFSSTALDVKVVDPNTGQETDKLASQAFQVDFSPDGAYLFLQGSTDDIPSTQVVDARTLESISELSKQHITPVRLLGGREILLSVYEYSGGVKLTVIDAHDLSNAGETWQINAWDTRGYPVLSAQQ